MKVATYSPNRLVIVERPLALAAVLIVVFVAVTAGFLQQWATLEPWMRALAIFWTLASALVWTLSNQAFGGAMPAPSMAVINSRAQEPTSPTSGAAISTFES
ncbi:MAG: hypothetical protein AAGC77_12550, partial [Pseudomonadota bacterium]